MAALLGCPSASADQAGGVSGMVDTQGLLGAASQQQQAITGRTSASLKAAGMAQRGVGSGGNAPARGTKRGGGADGDGRDPTPTVVPKRARDALQAATSPENSQPTHSSGGPQLIAGTARAQFAAADAAVGPSTGSSDGAPRSLTVGHGPLGGAASARANSQGISLDQVHKLEQQARALQYANSLAAPLALALQQPAVQQALQQPLARALNAAAAANMQSGAGENCMHAYAAHGTLVCHFCGLGTCCAAIRECGLDITLSCRGLGMV